MDAKAARVGENIEYAFATGALSNLMAIMAMIEEIARLMALNYIGRKAQSVLPKDDRFAIELPK